MPNKNGIYSWSYFKGFLESLIHIFSGLDIFSAFDAYLGISNRLFSSFWSDFLIRHPNRMPHSFLFIYPFIYTQISYNIFCITLIQSNCIKPFHLTMLPWSNAILCTYIFILLPTIKIKILFFFCIRVRQTKDLKNNNNK